MSYCAFVIHVHTCRHGVNKWRDSASPIEILYDWVAKKGWPNPVWHSSEDEVEVGGKRYKLITKKPAAGGKQVDPSSSQQGKSLGSIS